MRKNDQVQEENPRGGEPSFRGKRKYIAKILPKKSPPSACWRTCFPDEICSARLSVRPALVRLVSPVSPHFERAPRIREALLPTLRDLPHNPPDPHNPCSLHENIIHSLTSAFLFLHVDPFRQLKLSAKKPPCVPLSIHTNSFSRALFRTFETASPQISSGTAPSERGVQREQYWTASSQPDGLIISRGNNKHYNSRRRRSPTSEGPPSEVGIPRVHDPSN